MFQIFGEAVLGLSQGSVSELLSKPKPWHMLSIKGREPFIRMQLWLGDTNNVDRLQALKNERREANKRRRSIGPGAQDNSSDTSSNDTADFYTAHSPGPGSVGSAAGNAASGQNNASNNNNGGGGGGPPNKKQRVLFTEEQKEALRLAFALDPYPNVATIEFLASELTLSTRTITNWFHNHRMRLKQQVPHNAVNVSGGGEQPAGQPHPARDNQSGAAGGAAATPGAPFDPIQFRVLLNQRLVELQKERLGLAANAAATTPSATTGPPGPANLSPYAPYFGAANPQQLAALIGRGLLQSAQGIAAGGADAAEQLAALSRAFKEQLSGLDLSMGTGAAGAQSPSAEMGEMKRERSEEEYEDQQMLQQQQQHQQHQFQQHQHQLQHLQHLHQLHQHQLHMQQQQQHQQHMELNIATTTPAASPSRNAADDHGDQNSDADEADDEQARSARDSNDDSPATAAVSSAVRTASRRKPTAPQWVNPVWHRQQTQNLTLDSGLAGMAAALAAAAAAAASAADASSETDVRLQAQDFSGSKEGMNDDDEAVTHNNDSAGGLGESEKRDGVVSNEVASEEQPRPSDVSETSLRIKTEMDETNRWEY